MCELYAYYARTEPMFSNVLRDLELLPTIKSRLLPVVARISFPNALTELGGHDRCGRGVRPGLDRPARAG